MGISKKAAQITPSMTLAITAKAKKMMADGISIIGFGAGEPDFATPEYICDAAKRAIDEGKTKYTVASGTVALREQICKKFKDENGLDYTASQIVVSNGAKHSLFNALYAVIDDGDEVILPTPAWLTYPELVAMCGGVTVEVKTTKASGFKITAEQLKNAITKKTKALILNTPSNPCGAVYSKEELLAIKDVVEESGIFVISDEIYEHLVYGKNEHVSIASLGEKVKEQTIVINGVSKTYSMTGWRIGYLAAREDIAKAIGSVQSHMTSNPNSIAQEASLAALRGGKSSVFHMIKVFDERRELIYELANDIDGLEAVEPQGAFYLFVNVSALYGKKYKGSEIKGSLDLAEKLLDARVAVIPGAPFGDDDYIRLSYAISQEDIIEGMKRIKEFVSVLQ